MRHGRIFLLIFFAAIGLGTADSGAKNTDNGNYTNGMCNSSVAQYPCSPIKSFLQCSGFPTNVSDYTKDIRGLKGVMDTLLDVYSFMRSNFSQGPILEVFGGINMTLETEQLHDVDLMKMWFQLKLRPLLPSVSWQFLSCLSTQNFTCETYQAVVKELSIQFSNIDPVRQNWIYTFFMYPFLARNSTAGCLVQRDSSDWLMKNFGAFSVIAHLKDFRTLNIFFSGLEVLDLLTPEQMAELILHPEFDCLDNSSVKLVFESLFKVVLENQNLNEFNPMYNMSTPVPTVTPQSNLKEKFSSFLTFVNPLGKLIKEFVFLTQQTNLTTLKSTTLTQAVMNWTLAELAGHFTQNINVGNDTMSNQTSLEQLDITNIDSWFQHVVVPVLRRFQLFNETEIPQPLSAVFYNLFLLNSTVGPDQSGPPDTCYLTTDNNSCSVSDTLENLSYILKCISRMNLSLTEENLQDLVTELSAVLNTFIHQFSTPNLTSVSSQLEDLLGQSQIYSFTKENLHDVNFIRLWFQIELRPLLPIVSKEFLSCLSTKDFTCETYQTIVKEMSGQMSTMDRDRQKSVYTYFIPLFLSKNNTSDPACISNTNGSIDWLKKNFGEFSVFASLEDLQKLNHNFSSFESLALLSPIQAAELTLTSGALNDIDKINIVFNRLEENNSFQDVDEFLTHLTTHPELVNISPAVRHIMMNRTFLIISQHFLQFKTKDWVDWFNFKLIPLLPSFDGDMLSFATININCSNYQVIVKGINMVFHKMTLEKKREITSGLVKYLKKSIVQLTGTGCQQDGVSDAQWLSINLGTFLEEASYSDLKDLNINALEVLDTLSPDQKAELILDPSTGALENATIIKNVFISLLESPSIGQLDTFFDAFVRATVERNVTFIENSAVRDIMLNLTLTELAPRFDIFEASDFAIWFQVNLVLLMASIHPDSLAVIPSNISCDSYLAIFKGLDQSLKSLPPQLTEGIESSKDLLMQRAPKNCMMLPSVGQCKETPVDEASICSKVDSQSDAQQLELANSSLMQCNFSIENYACSSVPNFTKENLVTILKCKLASNIWIPAVTWKLFFTKVSSVLDEALDTYSSGPYNTSRTSMTYALDAIGELRVNNFSETQLKDVNFINQWFNRTLQPLLPFVSEGFLSCLSTKIFSCETYQAVVKAMSNQYLSMDRIRRQIIYTHFIHLYLSRNDSSEYSCISNTSGSIDWLQKNFGEFYVFASLEDLKKLNTNFSSFESLALLTPAQTAELTLTSGALNNPDKINIVFDHLERDNALQNVDEFLTLLVTVPEIPDISPTVRDFMMNRIFLVISHRFPQFESADWINWFHIKLIPILPSFNSEMLKNATFNISCTNYQAIVKGMDMVFPKMTPGKKMEITRGLVEYLKKSIHQTNEPACRQQNQNNTVWLSINLGKFSNEANYSDLKDFNITGFESLALLSPTQAAELTLTSGALNDTDKINIVFEQLGRDNALQNVNEFLTLLATQSQIPDISPTVRDFMMNQTFLIISDHFPQFESADWINWFHIILIPILPSFTSEMLKNATFNISCPNYQAVVKGMDMVFPKLTPEKKQEITRGLLEYLKKSIVQLKEPECKQNISDDTAWLSINLGKFLKEASFSDLKDLNITVMEALPLLSVRQLAALSSTPGYLNSTEDVNKLMFFVDDVDFTIFFDIFSPAIQAQESLIPSSVHSAMLQQVFDRGNLSESTVDEAEVFIWLQRRLRPLLTSMSNNHVAPFFNITKRRCSTIKQGVELLNSTLSTLPEDTQSAIQSNILMSLKEPTPLQCYSNNSFYLFLESSFLGFQFPNLSQFVSLMPEAQKLKLINSMTPSELGSFLKKPNVVDNEATLCTIFKNYSRTPDFLETVDIPDNLRKMVMPCVWPLALNSGNKKDADVWFEKRLRNYLKFLTKDLVSSKIMLNAKCLSFQKFVSVFGNNNSYINTDLTESDVYDNIKTYLSSGTTPKCYNESDPQLNSTAWFVEYIGVFIKFISLDDLNQFGSLKLQPFAENLENIQLFNQTGFPDNVSSFLTQLIYHQNSNFNPFLLPSKFQCSAPGSAFLQLNKDQATTVVHKITQSCGKVDPQISAALAEKIEISADTIMALGQESIALSVGNITSAPPDVIEASLQTLSIVTGWNLGQAIAIVQVLLTSVTYQKINSSQQLENLGSIVAGVPSTVFVNIPSAQLQQLTQNPTFINNILSAPQIIQYTFVNQLIKTDTNQILLNVPDDLATEIPRALLTNFPSQSFLEINKKRWKYEQAVLFFDTVKGVNNFTNISSYLLQGFTCTRIQTFKSDQVINLIKACRRGREKKVVLRETQLTCMHNYLLNGGNISNNFAEYPSNLLLYYNYKDVLASNCNSYFVEIGSADFSVLSESLKFKELQLLQNAKNCLGISGTNLSKENVEVLGNMCCTLDGTYIENSDPLILEKLKNCNDLSSAQVTAMENLLFTGKTKYGGNSTWNLKTLEDLGILPLYLTKTFWIYINSTIKGNFLRSFSKKLREDKKIEKKKLSALFQAITAVRSKRAAVNECTSGIITSVIIADQAFPFGYDNTQFNCCLNANVVKDNLAAIIEKVFDNNYQRIILDKLNQAYPQSIPDEQVQVLGSASRVASVMDIEKWNVTKIDTLSALMDSSNGPWDQEKVKIIITKYLNTAGNTLGTAELNSIGGTNLCSLDELLLGNISTEILSNANALVLSNCSTEKKKALFKIADKAFSSRNTTSLTVYQLIESYLSGAPTEYMKKMASSNVSMDISTFKSLNEDVILALNVQEVKGLLGLNLNDLKSFENDPVIQKWIRAQFQSDLNTLGLGLSGGKDIPTTTMAPIKTTSGGRGIITKSSHVQQSFLLVFTITALLVLREF